MSVTCQSCGSENRESAKFCIGCAQPLPAFMPSGPSALDAMKSWRPEPRPYYLKEPGPRASSVTMLPAESPVFWLRLGLVAVVMGVVFFAWYLYVTRSAGESPLPAGLAGVFSSEQKAMPAAEAAATAGVPAARESAQAAATQPATAPLTVAKPEAAPDARAALSLPAARSAAAAPQAKARPGPATSVSTAAAPPGFRTRAPARGEDRDSYREAAPPLSASRVPMRPGEESARLPWRPPATETSRAPVRAAVDPGPPVAAGPGPQYAWTTRSSARLADDPGPPIVAGPGPLVSSSRAPARAADDLGPPIAVGPGPLYNPVRAPRSQMAE